MLSLGTECIDGHCIQVLEEVTQSIRPLRGDVSLHRVELKVVLDLFEDAGFVEEIIWVRRVNTTLSKEIVVDISETGLQSLGGTSHKELLEAAPDGFGDVVGAHSQLLLGLTKQLVVRLVCEVHEVIALQRRLEGILGAKVDGLLWDFCIRLSWYSSPRTRAYTIALSRRLGRPGRNRGRTGRCCSDKTLILYQLCFWNRHYYNALKTTTLYFMQHNIIFQTSMQLTYNWAFVETPHSK